MLSYCREAMAQFMDTGRWMALCTSKLYIYFDEARVLLSYCVLSEDAQEVIRSIAEILQKLFDVWSTSPLASLFLCPGWSLLLLVRPVASIGQHGWTPSMPSQLFVLHHIRGSGAKCAGIPWTALENFRASVPALFMACRDYTCRSLVTA